MPAPRAVISVPISALPSMRSKRARSTFKILPLSGRIAWNLRSRPCFAEPPAESPSTMNNSHFDGSRSWQSASLPGRVEMSSTPLRRVSSRALRAASRAAAASITFWMMPFASFGCVSNQCATASATTACTAGCTSELTSFSFVCDENFGSGTFTDSTAVMPSRMSSPTSDRLSFLPIPSAYLLTTRVSAWRNPARWVPPSRCGMLLVKHSMVSWKLSFQDSANSTLMPVPFASAEAWMGGANTDVLARSSHSTNATSPPS